MKRLLLVLIVCCCMAVQKNYAQNFPDIKFSFLSTNNGLPTNQVTTIFEDSRGLVWIGTNDKGLLRYDGKKIKSYHSMDDSGPGIPSNYINLVCEDEQGWLWVSTVAGLYHIDPITEKTEAYFHIEADKNSVATNEKARPFVDSKGRLWVTGSNGLQQFDPGSKKFINYSTPPILNSAWQAQAKGVNVMMEDSYHRLWAGSAYGLYLVDTGARSLIPYFTGSYIGVTSIYEDEYKQIWVSFWGGGLKKFNPATNQYTDAFNPTGIIQFVNQWEDANKKKWLCFFVNNVFTLFDPLTKQYKYYQEDITKINSIKGKSVSFICNGNDSRLWICTQEGINIIDRKLQQFTNHPLYTYTDKNNSIVLDEPQELLVNPDEYFLSTWYRGHLYKYDKTWKLKKIINRVPPNSRSAYSQAINTMQKDDQGNTWYGTDSGLVKQTGDTYKCYLPDDNFAPLENRYAAGNILKRSDGLYWARFAVRGTYIFDATKGKFYKNYRNQYRGFTTCMEYDKTGILWLGTKQGLYFYQPSSDSFARFPLTDPYKPANEFYNNVFQFFFDENNTGWVGTYYGLLKLEEGAGKAETIIDPEKTQKYIVNRLLPDSAGTIWMATNSGLTAYNKKTKSFRYFTSDNGLPENFQGFDGVLNWTDDSTIVVGNPRVITTFNPYRLSSQATTAKILFTDISIDDNRAMPGSDKQQKINVPAGVNVISIHFALLNYTAPQQNKLYYRLSSGKTSNWIETTDGDITLLDLPGGNYLLEVKGECNGDILNSSTDKLIIIVQPYWYQLLSFKIAAGLVLCGLIYFIIRIRVKAVRKASALKEHIAATEMAALKAQLNPHFMFNCINSIDSFIHSNDKYNATLYLNKFAKLLRNILDSSKQNTVYFTKDMETLKLYIELEELRNGKKFRTVFTIDNELLASNYVVPPLIIQPFVENAILHGLRNKDGNEGLLEIKINRSGDSIEYVIKDNGIGRKAAGHITANNSDSYGMQLSYDRIRIFNKEPVASVKVNDLYNNGLASGTSVIVQLKVT